MKTGICMGMALAIGYGCVIAGLPDFLIYGVLAVFALTAFTPEFADALHR